MASDRAPASSFAVTVTVRSASSVAPSETLVGESVSVTFVDVASSSVIVSVCGSGCVTPWPFAARPVTVTGRLPSSVALSFAVTVTVPVLTVSSAAMVSTVVPLRSKSSAAVPVPGEADTVIVVSSLDGWSRVAVTVLTRLASEIDAGVSTRVTLGVASSSMIVTVRSIAGSTLRPEVVVPLTVTVSSGSSMSSWRGSRAKVAVPLVAPASIVRGTSDTAE